MRKLNYFIVGVSRLIMGTIIINFVSCVQNLKVRDNSPKTAEATDNSQFLYNYRVVKS